MYLAEYRVAQKKRSQTKPLEFGQNALTLVTFMFLVLRLVQILSV